MNPPCKGLSFAYNLYELVGTLVATKSSNKNNDLPITEELATGLTKAFSLMNTDSRLYRGDHFWQDKSW